MQTSQNWLNTTYGGELGYVPAPTDGFTGWDTMYSLTRALQIELGISSPSDTFGSLTLSTLTSHGNIKSTESNANIVGILQCALWCKGYWGDTSFGTWTSDVTTSVSQVRTAMGLGSGSAVTPKMLKSLLTMDAYVVVGSGTTAVRDIQRWMNGRYKDRAAYFLIPCDGLFSRDVQYGLMLAIQYEIGMDDGVANGNLGPGTKQGIINYGNASLGSVDGARRMIRLFQAALTFNGYSLPFDGIYGSLTKVATDAFQAFVALPVTSNSDFPTWASLLVSTGDVNRPGTACDCVTTITNARATTLLSAGYTTVGRYLTNYPGGTLDKKIKPGELTTIFNNGMSVFPIFQVGGDSSEYFSSDQGFEAGKAAHAAARAYGFRPGTVIYFAIDFDALEGEVWDLVVPHFEGIQTAFSSINSDYSVGIYGARNTCSIVSAEGLSASSFVGGMSTGYSGNLGFPLPSDWAFDQILEYSIGSGSGAIAIDKDIASGRNPGETSLRTPENMVTYFSWLHSQAVYYRSLPGWSGTETDTDLVLQYLRQPRYDDVTWTWLLGPVNSGWISFVNGLSVARVFGLISPGSGHHINANHLAASLHGKLKENPSNFGYCETGDMAGWAGDVAQVMGRFVHARRSDSGLDAYSFGRLMIARPNGDTPFGPSDFDEDIDAMLLADAMLTAPDIATAVANHYDPSTGGCLTRYSSFLSLKFGNDLALAYDWAIDAMTSLEPNVTLMRSGIYGAEVGIPIVGPGEITYSDVEGIAQAWQDTLGQKIDEE